MDDAEEKKRLNFEAAEWVKRFNLMKADHGLITASAWWGQTIRDIEKRRGPKAAQELRDAMTRLKK